MCYPNIQSCIVWKNGDDLKDYTATYSCISDVNDANGTGNITSDPCFVNVFDFIDETDANGTTTTIIVTDANIYEVNDVIEHDDDGVIRTVTDVNTSAYTITFTPALDANSEEEIRIYNWGIGATDINENFHLVFGSPCINAGDPNGDYTDETDIDGQIRVQGGTVDMGADEAQRIHNVNKDLWYSTINVAVDDANDGDTIVVEEGIYREIVYFDGKAITIQSTDPNNWDVVEDTIIDANGLITGCCFNSGEDANSILNGLTIRFATSSNILLNASPTIKNCIIEKSGSSGIYCSSSAAPTITNNIIRDNDAYGISGSHNTYEEVLNNLIYNNSSGLAIHNSIVRNNTIVYNTNYGVKKIAPGTPPAEISNCILWGNSDDLGTGFTATYSCIEDGDSGTGNIASDPCFVDEANDDFRLVFGSPCTNAGDPNGSYTGQTDIDGNPRVMALRVDMGADEAEYFDPEHEDYDEWVSVGRPDCWCFTYHCDGDADGLKKGDPATGYYHVEYQDLNLIYASWKLETSNSNFNICADVSRSINGDPITGYYRVEYADLNLVFANWKLPDPNLGGNCGGDLDPTAP